MPKLVGNRASFRSHSLAGRGWGCCGPIEEQHSAHSASLSSHRPTLHLGLIKGVARSRWSLSSLYVLLFFRTLLVCDCQNTLLLQEPDPGRLPSFETPCRAVDVPPPPHS